MPKPEESNSGIENSSDEMSKDFSSEDRNEAPREWTLSECQER